MVHVSNIKCTINTDKYWPLHSHVCLHFRSKVLDSGILELQGWTNGMDPDSDPDLSLFIAVMTLVIGVMSLFIGIMTLIRGLVLRLMASLIVHAPQIVYIMGMWSELK